MSDQNYLFMYSWLNAHIIKSLITFYILCTMNLYLLIKNNDFHFYTEALLGVAESDCMMMMVVVMAVVMMIPKWN